MTKVDPGDFLHGADKVLGGYRLSVEAFEIEIRAFPEQFRAQKVGLHPDDLGSLLIDGNRVKIGDFHVRLGAHRVRHWSGILGKLNGAQKADILHTLHCPRTNVSRKFGIAVNREAFLKTELEPVAAGDTVARPVVKILVGNDGLDALKSLVGRSFRLSEHAGGIEDIQALVLHGAHIKIVDGHDHENIEVVFPAVDFLIPAHGFFQGSQSKITLIQVFFLDKNTQLHFTARAGGERIIDRLQVAGHESKQVAWLFKGIFPRHPVPTIVQVATADVVAV